ncbi:hypothetical protein [Chryseolinea sp. H1M3-3]|uniref:hypothetical protein n=1 Tax=Chryseolinea sp. H1M3-3 TaxID=3034144 RepID=UPI0023ED567D|nr:hypothetical protein [Chryseolinea sp. H1M3-3]
MNTDNREFFEQLGNLFYSLALDRSIDPIEYSELKMLISKDWMSQPQDSDMPIPENVHLMFVEMDALQTTNVSSADAYNSFARYYATHPEAFTQELVERIQETATSINSFFPAHNPYRKNHLGDLLILLRNKTNIPNY